MTRKDTIIIAVFVNAAILIALFVSAVRSNKSEDKSSVQVMEESPKAVDLTLAKVEVKSDAKPLNEPGKTEVKAAEGDEVDLVLKQFAQNTPAIATDATPMAANPAAPAVDFARELQAFGIQSPDQQPAIAVATETNVSSESAKLIEVTVKKGDALEKIARAHQTTVKEITRINNLKNANLKIGQVLKVAPGVGRGKKAAATTSLVRSEEPKYYVVKNGDSPWSIAVKNHMKVEELLRLNHMDQDKARHLKAGDKLRIK